MIKNVLSIAGTDPTGGAGIHADIKTFSAMGAYAMAAVTAVVAQNTQGVRSLVALEPEFVAEQIDAVFDDVRVDAVKIGAVANAGIAEAIADRLQHYGADTVVLDPVMVAKSGDRLLEESAVQAVRERLVPVSTIITPNLPEAEVLLDGAPLTTDRDRHDAAQSLRGLGCDWVLLKGGHTDDPESSTDLLHGPNGTSELRAPRICTTNDHGTGCTLAAAIAALIPSLGVEAAVQNAKTYLNDALAASDRLDVGRGHGPLHHFVNLWNQSG